MSTSNNNQIMPVVQEGILAYRKDGRDYRLRVSTPAWYSWLDTARTFAFRSGAGTFTARKEQAGHKRGGWYWRAYCKRGGKLHSAYIGTAEELTMERLTIVAASLASEVGDEHSLGAGVSEKQGQHWGGVVTHEGAQAEYPSSQPTAARPVLERLNRPSSILPVPLTSLIGREREIAAACTRLSRPETRLLTLTGTAGVGKTRLALAIAARMQEEFQEGGCFVSLAPIQDANLVFPALVQALGLYATGTASPLEHLQAALRERHLLVLLDNFEQVVEAAPSLVELLAACPRLKLLVTSRQVLHVRGEHEFPLQPLALPETKHLPERETLERYGAVALFLERAREIQPTFQLGDEQAPLVVEICRRLDGLPLAIELAVARLKLLPLQSLLERLEHPLQLLTGGARDLPARQQTLRNTLAWSYGLLSEEEQRLFLLLSVFVGGCDLAAAEAVYSTGGEQPPVLDAITSLLDKHLLRRSEQGDDAPRLLMHETIREYGLEVLITHREMEMAQQTHALYYLSLAEEAEPHLESAEQARWLARLEREHANLRAALDWLLERQENELALQLSSALFRFWEARRYLSEGRHFLECALSSSQDVAAGVRAKALLVAGFLALEQSDLERGVMLGQEAVALQRELGDARHLARSLYLLGVIAWVAGDLAMARSYAEEGLAIARTLDEKFTLPYLLDLLGQIALDQVEDNRARALLEEGLTLHREIGDTRGSLNTLFSLMRMLSAQGEVAVARAFAEEQLALSRAMGFRVGIAGALSFLGRLALQEGNVATAGELFEESLALLHEVNESWGIATNLLGIGVTVAAQGRPAEAARLWGAAETLCAQLRAPLPPEERAFVARASAAVRTELDEEAFRAAWAEGRAMTLEQVLETLHHTALSSHPPTKATRSAGADRQQLPSSSPPDDLTGREMEVLRLVAQGLTDAQIAEALVISPRTVNAHLRSIYSKLDITSRNAATRYALDHHRV